MGFGKWVSENVWKIGFVPFQSIQQQFRKWCVEALQNMVSWKVALLRSDLHRMTHELPTPPRSNRGRRPCAFGECFSRSLFQDLQIIHMFWPYFMYGLYYYRFGNLRFDKSQHLNDFLREHAVFLSFQVTFWNDCQWLSMIVNDCQWFSNGCWNDCQTTLRLHPGTSLSRKPSTALPFYIYIYIYAYILMLYIHIYIYIYLAIYIYIYI